MSYHAIKEKSLRSCITRLFLAGLTCSWTALTQVANAQTASDPKPNMLVIIADDLGWSDIGYNGSIVQTPNLDALAKTGVRMDYHYVAPTCTPTRVAFLTGKYPSRYGILGPDYGEVIYEGEPTLASLLRSNGYYTAIAGKWHLGSPPHTPLRYGFASSYGYLDGQIDPYTHQYKTGPNSWHRNDKRFTEEGHATDLITREAVRIIEQTRDEPFFLYVAYSVPHYPLEESEEWTSRYDALNLSPSRKLFAASVTHMDAGIGKILDALQRTGKRDNTLILFISDNGGQHSWDSEREYGGKYRDIPHDVLGNNFPLRGWKGDVYEGGIRVPAIANWRGQLRAGVASFPVHAVDWLPTLSSLAGINAQGDGQNVWSQLNGDDPSNKPRQFYWKTPSMTAVRDGDWKLVVTRDGEELFNLGEDFREMNDVKARHPERVEALKQLLERFEKGDRPKR